MEKVLECPHCGGRSILTTTTVCGDNSLCYIDAQVVCTKCEASGKKIKITDYLCDESVVKGCKEAVRSWNNRV